MDNLLLSIRESYHSFTQVEKKIASFILKREDEILSLSIKTIAAQCNTSQAAIVRFCKSMGLRGYKDFKISLNNDMFRQIRQSGESSLQVEDITGFEPIEDVVQKVISHNIRSILDTQSLIDLNQLRKAIDIIASAARIDIYGVGASGLVAQDAFQKLIRIGKICNASVDPHVQITMATTLQKGDVAIVISYSGMTSDMLDIAGLVKETGAYLIAITKYSQENKLSKISDLSLHAASPEISMRIGAMGSRISQLTIIDLLFVGVASRNDERYQKSIQRSYEKANLRKFR